MGETLKQAIYCIVVLPNTTRSEWMVSTMRMSLLKQVIEMHYTTVSIMLCHAEPKRFFKCVNSYNGVMSNNTSFYYEAFWTRHDKPQTEHEAPQNDLQDWNEDCKLMDLESSNVRIREHCYVLNNVSNIIRSVASTQHSTMWPCKIKRTIPEDLISSC